ncbi:MAG TPA: SDR family NAD(P)-dependent oxidoreductase [Gemmatimonadaceae bacterium]|jgi:NAD(P)-dependent dehydrogenase (short-subunit alcohol dehydrogenase family)|nr:SDR family NAD(P)-dependent oxidoreductase [Gemmatimonadaceae bacterium]
MVRHVVITGASTGIGLATARVLASRGVHVFGSVRREADADRLRTEIGRGVTPLLFDVTDVAAMRAAASSVAAAIEGRTLWGLVNNAGIAIGGPLLYQPLDEIRRHLEVNVLGAIAAVQAFAPLLGTDRGRTGAPGRIVNISSVAGRLSAPFLGAYAASKRALEGMSHSLRRELMMFGIDVVIINPGSVATPIWDKAEEAGASPYEHTEYAAFLPRFLKSALRSGRSGLPPEAVGEAVWKALTVSRPRTSYAVVPRRFLNWTIPLALPARLIDWLIAKRLGIGDRPSGAG